MEIEDAVPTVREASQTGLTDRPDAALPMIAAHWLADGLDTPQLRALAGLGRSQAAAEARQLLSEVLKSLNSPLAANDNPWIDQPWRGYWTQIIWARREIGYKLTAFAAAQRVLEVIGDAPELWEPGHGPDLRRIVERWDSDPVDRPQLERQIVTLLGTLRENDVPAVRT